MSKSGTKSMRPQPLRTWRSGLGPRLLVAFLGVATFGALAAASAIYALHQLGDRFDVVDARLPRAVSALELSRSAERIVATAPALLAVADQRRRREISASLDAEAQRLLATLEALTESGAALPTAGIGPIVTALAADLGRLDELVGRRLTLTERTVGLRSSILSISEQVDRLLATWIEIVESEIGSFSLEAAGESQGAADARARLAVHLDLLRELRAAQVQATSISEMLGEASTSRQARRLEVLAFQVTGALDELENLIKAFDPRLHSMLRPRIGELRTLAGPQESDSLLRIRREELALQSEGAALVETIGDRSAELVTAVDQLSAAATAEIGTAIEDAVVLQQRSTWLLVLIAAAAVLASALIAWLYVGRNVVRRLNTLSEGTLAIAGGDLEARVPATGADEITAMARAVETFRRNTQERNALLVEKGQAADRLEKVVHQRTAELSRSMREVEEKSRALENANRFKSRFLAAASHDLRQPLHALNLFVAQLRAESDAAEQAHLLEQIEAAVGSMNDLFDALLDMTKLDAGVVEPKVQHFAVQPLLTRLRTTFSEIARDKGLRFTVVGSESWVASDPVLLERLLINLVSNAVRYTERGGVVVGCRRSGENLRIEVWDSGVGIPEKDRTKILGEFVQLAPDGTGRRRGLGLGLSIVARLADLLGHRIEIASQIGKGSRFAVVVPTAQARELPVAAAPADIAEAAIGSCVLIIDDDPLALDGMSGILRRWGFEVIALSSPDRSRLASVVRRSKPGLIISDLHLGNGSSGMELIEYLHAETGAAIPAFLVSGDTTPEGIEKARAAGYHLLHKPVTPIRLRAMVNRMTRSPMVSEADPRR